MRYLGWFARLSALVALASGGSCAGVVDVDALQEDCAGDTENCCSVSQKLCAVESSDGTESAIECVSQNDPDYGCGGDSCSPCEIEHAFAICDPLGNCVASTCEPGYNDCDGRAFNGCEIQVSGEGADMNHCGICGNRCEFQHGTGHCNGQCRLLECDPGWDSCSDLNLFEESGMADARLRVSKGEDCETDITTTEDCGACGNRCADGEECVLVGENQLGCQ